MKSPKINTGFISLSNHTHFLISHIVHDCKEAVIFLAPFAEEMNKSRHLINKTMQQLQTLGISSFMLDNYGTGDSESDLDAADMLIWQKSLLEFFNLLCNEGFEEISFVAIRFGALQLFDLLNHHTLALKLNQIVLWQPFFDSAKFWQQFVRLKIAESMASGIKTSQKEIEQLIEQGHTVEIAGYPINLPFYQSVQQLKSHLPNQLAAANVAWLETSQLDNIALPVQKQIEQIQALTPISFKQLKAEPYWQTNELVQAPELINLTTQFITTGKLYE